MKSYLLSIMVILSSVGAQAGQTPGSLSQRIVGGVAAAELEVPFIVSLRTEQGEHYCGGSLIDKKWILTAAHCIEALVPKTVVMGTINLEPDKESQVYKVDRVFVHPDFNRSMDMSSDFALIKLKSESAEALAVLNTSDAQKMKGKKFLTAGWGALNENSGSSPDILQKVTVPFVNLKTCNKQFQKHLQSKKNFVNETMICAGYAQGQRDACQGDSGGPLYFKNSLNQFILTGVVSWGFGCARKNLSGVYSNVASAIEWIQKTQSEN